MIEVYQRNHFLPEIKKVMMRLGYRTVKTEVSPQVLSELESVLLLCAPLIEGRANVLQTRIKEHSGNRLSFDCGMTVESKSLSKLLAGSKTVSLLLLTIGSRIMDFREEMQAKGEMTWATMIDAIGSEAVEDFADYVTGVLKQRFAFTRQNPTMRFAPGYGDVSTSVHVQLFPLLEAEKIGMSYHRESFLMYPEKSISAFIGWK